jgi:cytochrome c5
VKIILRAGVAAVGLLGFASAFVHPFGRIKAQRSNEPLLAGAETTPELTRVLERSCQNCHSDRTGWPGIVTCLLCRGS